jgi:hypothetical protein
MNLILGYVQWLDYYLFISILKFGISSSGHVNLITIPIILLEASYLTLGLSGITDISEASTDISLIA